MRLSERILKGTPPGNFLALGSWCEVVPDLARAGWEGTWVMDPQAQWPVWDWLWKVNRIKADVGPDPHFVQTLEGHLVRAVTLQEIYQQFSGPYTAVLIDWPMMTRRLFHSPQVQLGRARVIVVPEDSHNEEVRKLAATQGYRFDDSMPDYCFMYW